MSTRKGKFGDGVCRATIEHPKLMNSGERIVTSKGRAQRRQWRCYGDLAKRTLHHPHLRLIHLKRQQDHCRPAFQCQMAKHPTMPASPYFFSMTALKCNSPPILHLAPRPGGEQEALLLACRYAGVGAADLWVCSTVS